VGRQVPPGLNSSAGALSPHLARGAPMLGQQMPTSPLGVEAKRGSRATHANGLAGILQLSASIPVRWVGLRVTSAARNGERDCALVIATLPVRVAQAGLVMGRPSRVGPVS
jgi:hypothetical protein